MEEGLKHKDVEKYLPETRDRNRLPRDWILNVIYTVAGPKFKEWVEKKCVERNDTMRDKRGLIINMTPSIAEIFSASTSVSSKYHNFFIKNVIFLLKINYLSSLIRNWR